MNVLPFLTSSLFGWAMGHVFVLWDRHDGWLRLINYPIGVAGAAIGTAVSQSSPQLYNKLFLLGILFSGIALLLYQSLRRLIHSRRQLDLSA